MPDTQSSPPTASPFWRFSLDLYRRPGVADACIALQEGSGVDVNLLLYLLWRATERRALARDDVQWLESRIGPWREATVVPLRSVRRALKAPPGLVEPAAAEAFRTRIKAVELEAERLQQEAMYALPGASSRGTELASPEAAARASIAAYETICTTAFSPPAVECLMGAFVGLAGT